MKEIFHEFGTAIIAIISGVLIIGLLFGLTVSGKVGILQIAGISTQKEATDYTLYQDFDAVITWQNRTKPVVAYTASYGRFFEDEITDFLERYYAEDMEGTVYVLDQVILTQLFTNQMFGKILDIRTEDGISILSSYNSTNGTIQFLESGVYEVYFQVRDKENLTSIWKIPIAVDEGR